MTWKNIEDKRAYSKIALKAYRKTPKYKAWYQQNKQKIYLRTVKRCIWRHMMARCYRTKNKDYKYYGGKGITVCDRWHKFANFEADMMATRPSKDHSLDRIDNTKGYSPENCKWSTSHEQLRNRSDNVWITHDGRTLILEDWAREAKIDVGTLTYRLKVGWSVQAALYTKPKKY